MYVLLSGLGTTLNDLLPLRRHVPLSVFYHLVKALEKHDGKLVFLGNLRQQDVPLLNLFCPFRIETIEYWGTLNYRDENLNFNSTQIWHNSLIRTDNKPFFYKESFYNKIVKRS